MNIEFKISNREISTSVIEGEHSSHSLKGKTADNDEINAVKKRVESENGTLEVSLFHPKDLRRHHFEFPTAISEVYQYITVALTFASAHQAIKFARDALGLWNDIKNLRKDGSKTITVKIDGAEITLKDGDDLEEAIKRYRSDEGDKNPF